MRGLDKRRPSATEEQAIWRTIRTSPARRNRPSRTTVDVGTEAGVGELKAKIAEAKAHNDMPFDSTLGNPNWDKNAADVISTFPTTMTTVGRVC